MKKRSVNISGHQTSVTLEDEFWNVLNQIARTKDCSVNSLISEIDKDRGTENLSSAIRVFILKELENPTR